MALHGAIPAVFMRGGTSKALVFHARDLPADRGTWPPIFLAAMGSPDPYGRQLDGMGGGVTSVSKVCVIGPPTRDDADVDYSFFQVLPTEARVLTRGNCGNMSAAVGPFAVDEGLVRAVGGTATIRIHNTNTGKIIRSTFPLAAGRAAIDGDLVIPGVHGSGAPVRLDFLDPGGATTGRLLPGGAAAQALAVTGFGTIEVSLVDVANPCVFVAAESVGLTATESPLALERDDAAMRRLHAIGAHAAVAMGRARDLDAGREQLPLIAVVAAPQASTTLSGILIDADAADLCVRMLSSGQPHRAMPATGAICTAVAMAIPGSVPQRLARPGSGGTRRIAMPSGVLHVAAQVDIDATGHPHALAGTVYRTARRLFDGRVHY